MLAALFIVFREVFEMAIIVCVVMAATKGLPHRGKWVGIGIAAGALGALILAILGEGFSLLEHGHQKLIFNAAVLFIAAILIAWTVVWMKQHGREIASHLKQVSNKVSGYELPMHMISVVVAIAVLREGSEIVLFLYGIAATGDISTFSILFGGFIGLSVGVLTGVLMYFGVLRIPVKYLFSTTSVLLTFIAAGMVANGVGKLVQANILPALGYAIWNTSTILSQDSLLGRLLHVLVGYQQQPEGIQLICYFITLLIVFSIPPLLYRSTSFSVR